MHSTTEPKTVTCLHYLIAEADEHRQASCSYVKLWGSSTGTLATPSQNEPHRSAFLSLLQVEPILPPSSDVSGLWPAHDDPLLFLKRVVSLKSCPERNTFFGLVYLQCPYSDEISAVLQKHTCALSYYW